MAFSPKFTKQLSPTGKTVYWFETLYKQTSATRNTVPPLAVNGDVLYSNDETKNDEIFKVLPDEISNPEVLKRVYDAWIVDCSGAFVKPPTIENCLVNTEISLDSSVALANILSSEESTDWLLQWVPTKIKVDSPKFHMYWAPCYKIVNTRIPEKIAIETIPDVDVQNPERTYTFTPGTTRLYNGEWLQEITDMPLPLSDSPALRLDIDMDLNREKMRRRVRDARLRAKLAKYRAERMAKRFEERYGIYPEEDVEEAQTEAETSGED
jgi:hypothetical protein